MFFGGEISHMYTKFKRYIISASVILILTMLSTNVFADDTYSIKLTQRDSILLDTNNPKVGIEIYKDQPITIFSYKNASASKSGRFYLKSNNLTLGEFKTTGKFTYDGTICNVISCKNSIWNVADGWRVKGERSKEQVSPTLAKVVGTFELYKEGNKGDTLSSSATITVSCNHRGKTNCEFNGDESAD